MHLHTKKAAAASDLLPTQQECLQAQITDLQRRLVALGDLSPAPLLRRPQAAPGLIGSCHDAIWHRFFYVFVSFKLLLSTVKLAAFLCIRDRSASELLICSNCHGVCTRRLLTTVGLAALLHLSESILSAGPG